MAPGYETTAPDTRLDTVAGDEREKVFQQKCFKSWELTMSKFQH